MSLIRGIDFGPVCGASGVQGFFGDPTLPEYKHQKLFGTIFSGYNFSEMGFVSKTTTAEPRVGNMSLRPDGIRLKSLWPSCIVAKPFKGIALNAVGLSGPGVLKLLQEDRWQKRTSPFRISFMAVAETREGKEAEARQFVLDLRAHLFGFRTREIMIQLNVSCPNVGLKLSDAPKKIDETFALISILSELNLSIEVKFVATIDPYVAKEIASHGACESICISNTLPWGQLPNQINWRKLFGLRGNGEVRPEESPLKKFGGGGLSGWPLLRITSQWVKILRQIGYKGHVNAGGGIMHSRDVHVLKAAGADSVFIGSVTMLRPWRVKSIIDEALVAFSFQNRVTFIP